MKTWYFVTSPKGNHLWRCTISQAWHRLLALCEDVPDLLASDIKEV